MIIKTNKILRYRAKNEFLLTGLFTLIILILLKVSLCDLDFDSFGRRDLRGGEVGENLTEIAVLPANRSPSLEKKDPISNRGKILTVLYGIVEAPEKASDEELMKACFVLAFMDNDLKNRKPYDWLSRKVIEVAKTRFQTSHLWSHGSARVIEDNSREQDRLRYDEFKFQIGQEGEMLLGRGSLLPQ